MKKPSLLPVRLGRGTARPPCSVCGGVGGGETHTLHQPDTGGWGGLPPPRTLSVTFCVPTPHQPLLSPHFVRTFSIYGWHAHHLQRVRCWLSTLYPNPWVYLKKLDYSTFKRGCTKVLCRAGTIEGFPSGSFYETMRLKGGMKLCTFTSSQSHIFGLSASICQTVNGSQSQTTRARKKRPPESITLMEVIDMENPTVYVTWLFCGICDAFTWHANTIDIKPQCLSCRCIDRYNMQYLDH